MTIDNIFFCYHICMTKSKKNIFNILVEAIGLYFSNIDKFIKYMSFPVLGQIAGLLIVFLITYFYSVNLPNLLEKYPNLNNFNTLVLMSVVITLPGLIIFCKAFWEYLVAYGAVNSMVENMQKSGRLYDFQAHTELVKRRAVVFIGLWFLFGVFSFVALVPFFWVICGILTMYFVLVFQAFTYNPELSPIGCVKKSLMLVKGHFASTFILFLLIGFITYFLIPNLFIKVFDILGASKFTSNVIMPFVTLFPEIHLEQYGLTAITHKDIALFTVEAVLAQILIQYTLPMRSILWSLWYKELGEKLILLQ